MPVATHAQSLITRRLTIQTSTAPEFVDLTDRVQQIVSEQLPFIFLATPNILTAAKPQVGNFQPALLEHYTLWNADQIYLRNAERAGIRRRQRRRRNSNRGSLRRTTG